MLRIYAIAAALLTALLGWAVWDHTRGPATAAPSANAVVASDSPQVEGKGKRDVPTDTGGVKAFDNGVKKKLRLPKPVAQDDKQVVTSAVDVPSSDHRQEVVAVTDTRTGETTSYVKEEPLPWFGLELRTSVSAYVGTIYGKHAGEIELRQDFLRVKGVVLEGKVRYDQMLETGSGEGSYWLGLTYYF